MRDGSHPVDGWPCDNLTHQPPLALCVELHRRIKQQTRIKSRPMTSQNPEQLRVRQRLRVTAACRCLCIFIICCPNFQSTSERMRFFSLPPPPFEMIQSCLFFHILWLDEIWICHHGNHHIWFFVYMLSCAKHFYHPTFQPSGAYPGHAPPHHGHLDMHTLKCVVLRCCMRSVQTGALSLGSWRFQRIIFIDLSHRPQRAC